MPEISPLHNRPEYTVSEIAAQVKRVVEDTFGIVRVRGEISGWKLHSSGHCYLSLKDDKSVLAGVCWKGNAQRLNFKPEDGLEVVCTGRITTYAGQSKYQMVIESMEPAGIGALMALLEKRKAQLAAEGLFDEKRKKPLPFMPQVIGVITSPTGAVIRDILHRLRERFPVHVLVWPVAVQGEGAAEQVAAAIEGFNALPETRGEDSSPREPSAREAAPHVSDRMSRSGGTIKIPKPEVLIVARGGGSIEDLWAFNEEIVVRAAAASKIPLISAVGHETDTTLIDYASDRRAPTPTAAAEMAVPVRDEWLMTIAEYGTRIQSGMLRALQQKQEQVKGFARGLTGVAQLVEFAVQRLDDWGERLHAALPAFLQAKAQQFAVAIAGLKPRALLQDWQRVAERTQEIGERLTRIFTRLLEQEEKRLSALTQMLETLNYKKVLERGFALVKNAESKLVTAVAGIGAGQALTLTFHDGEARVKAEGTAAKSATPKPAKAGQGTLF